MKRRTLFVLLLGFFLLLTRYTYGQIFETFYQQDEWYLLGNVLVDPWKALMPPDSSVLQILAGQGRVLGLWLSVFFTALFPFSILPFAVFGIIVHAINATLVFFFVRRVTQEWLGAIVASVFFVAGYASHQAVSWASAVTTTLPSGLFVLLSLCVYFDYLKDRKRFSLFLSCLFFLISYYFKESAIVLCIYYPFLYVIYKKKDIHIYNILKTHLFFLIFAFLIISFRVIDILLLPHTAGNLVQASSLTIPKIISRIVLYPATTISQVFVPPKVIFALANVFEKANYPFIAGTNWSQVVAESIVSDILSLLFSFVIVAIVVSIYAYSRTHRKTILAAFVLLCLSIFPYILVDRGNAFLESRYYYFSMVPAGILLGVVFEYAVAMLNRRKKISSIWLKILAFSFFIGIIGFQVHEIQKDLKQQKQLAQQRKEFFESLSQYYPVIPADTVFYVTGDQDYYIAGNNVPLQQGVGYTLMVWYYRSGSISNELMGGHYLWDLGTQGYRSVGSQSFGYFWDIDQLREHVIKHSIDLNRIIGLYYRGKDKHLEDITQATRKEMLTVNDKKVL